MAISRKYTKIDALRATVEETNVTTKVYNVDGVYAKKKELEDQLAVVNDVIAQLKENGLDFSAHEPEAVDPR